MPSLGKIKAARAQAKQGKKDAKSALKSAGIRSAVVNTAARSEVSKTKGTMSTGTRKKMDGVFDRSTGSNAATKKAAVAAGISPKKADKIVSKSMSRASKQITKREDKMARASNSGRSASAGAAAKKSALSTNKLAGIRTAVTRSINAKKAGKEAPNAASNRTARASEGSSKAAGLGLTSKARTIATNTQRKAEVKTMKALAKRKK
jgi:hypothetical protein